MTQEIIKEEAIKNTKIAIVTQGLVLITSLIKSFIIPLLVSVESFGYWQIYLLYLPYIGLFYWGFNDGIYLRYGNYDYKDLPRKKFRSSISIFFVCLVIETIIGILLLYFFNYSDKSLALMLVVFNIPIKGIYGTLIYVFQITNNIKKYCLYSLIDKVIFILLLGSIFFINEESYLYLIWADIISSVLTTIFMIYENKEIIFGKKEKIKTGIEEFFNNIKTGISLMIASFMALILSNIGKIFVEQFNEVEDYAYYSFGMMIINLLLVCFISVSTVMYPMLKRMEKKDYGKQFNVINKYYDIIALTGLVLYFIAYYGIILVFPKYMNVLAYLNILFAIVIFQGKTILMNNTYYKILREEKRMMIDNTISIVIFVVLCMFSKSIIGISIITLIVMAHRAIDSEMLLRNKMGIIKNNTLPILMLGVSIFMVGTSINYILGLVSYLAFYLVYFLKNRKKFLDLLYLVLRRERR
ncbi:MAG: oligosaccharide flippase family protein [Clostridia bacterium]|nr:oligosaccharide flippase family protein [Clostridia bacterium]